MERRLRWVMRCDCRDASVRVLVIEETGWGLVPPTAIGGLFRDRLGLLAERLNTLADDSWVRFKVEP